MKVDDILVDLQVQPEETSLPVDDLPPQFGHAIVDLLQHSTNFRAGSHLERELVVLKMSSTNRGR